MRYGVGWSSLLCGCLECWVGRGMRVGWQRVCVA